MSVVFLSIVIQNSGKHRQIMVELLQLEREVKAHVTMANCKNWEGISLDVTVENIK